MLSPISQIGHLDCARFGVSRGNMSCAAMWLTGQRMLDKRGNVLVSLYAWAGGRKRGDARRRAGLSNSTRCFFACEGVDECCMVGQTVKTILMHPDTT